MTNQRDDLKGIGTWDAHRSCWIPEYGKQDELAAQLGDGWTFDEYYGGFFGPPAAEEPKAEADPNMGWVYGFSMPAYVEVTPNPPVKFYRYQCDMSNPAPANAEVSHESAPSVPGGGKCSPSSERAPNVDDVREFLGSSSEYEHGFLRRKECDALAHEYPAALGWEPYLDPRTMTTYFRRQRG
jgi:hypothetical protein